jgi:hypothetical protein
LAKYIFLENIKISLYCDLAVGSRKGITGNSVPGIMCPSPKLPPQLLAETDAHDCHWCLCAGKAGILWSASQETYLRRNFNLVSGRGEPVEIS